MRIPSSMTNDELETLYTKIGDDSINLPTSFKKLRLGLLPRICQLLITALKPDPNKKIKFPQFESHVDGAVKKLLEDPQSLTALMMSDEVFEKDIEVEGKKQPKELKSVINQNMQKRLNQSLLGKNHRLQLFAVDHSTPKYQFPACFYFPETSDNLRLSAYYNDLISRSLKSSNNAAIQDSLSGLGQLMFELVENTHQHGRQEINVGKVKKSVRGMVIDYKLITAEQTSENIGGENTAITHYLTALREDNPTLHLLEISLFDSGYGILKSLVDGNTKTMPIQKEVEIIEKSFAKGVTSKADLNGYGRGLFNVREVLDDRKGFISLRTGRVSLYRDFNSNPLTESEQEPLSLYDEQNQSNERYKALATTEGLAFSIVVSLR